jgi:cold shock CspA family protein
VTTTARARATRTGVVSEFDDPRGLGSVLGDDGRRYEFHCTAVADGSRSIDVGTRVTFILAVAHRGRLEARDIIPGRIVAGTGPIQEPA